MRNHKYILEPYKGMNTRYHCPDPNCGRGNTFSFYIDSATGVPIHPSVGRCNREINCGYHYTPKQYFQDNNISIDKTKPLAYKHRSSALSQKSVSFIPIEMFKASLKAFEKNHFVQFLINLFGVEVTNQLVSRYFIATSNHWNGATIFWQIDLRGKVRTGKIMLYNSTTGKRIKEPFNRIQWVHKALKLPEFELGQCLFGEHLLNEKDEQGNLKPVAIVESEKTAIISSVYKPEFIWVAVGSLTNLNAEKCKILKGRTIVLFPDLKGYDKWNSKAKELAHLAYFLVSDLLELKSTEEEKKLGLDIADYLIKHDYKDFGVINPIDPETSTVDKTDEGAKLIVKIEPDYNPQKIEKPVLKNWDIEIAEFENFFSGITIPTEPIKTVRLGYVNNLEEQIKEHLSFVKAKNGNPNFKIYLIRLFDFKSSLINFEKNNLLEGVK